MLDPDYLNIATHLAAAIIAGGAIGLERSFHGRAAGFRTHTLVCLSSSLLMLITFYQTKWMPGMEDVLFQTDPTRMAQGIMTGIGFLGAGVIYKENFSVRGLTTAASIWITSAIGILMGIGFYFPAILSTVLALGVLSLFRHIEEQMETQSYAHYLTGFDRQDTMPEEELRELLTKHGFTVSDIGYGINHDKQLFEYKMTLRTIDADNTGRLAASLRDNSRVKEFTITPASN